jgi:hypothetical protein
VTDKKTGARSGAEPPAGYQRTGAPGPGSPEYDAMDKLAKLFEAQVEDLRGEDAPKQH